MRADWEREALAAVEKATKERVVGYAQMVLIVAQTLEPLIRAEEYEMCSKRLDDMDYFMTNQRENLLAELHDKAAVLPTWESANSLCLIREDVLALFTFNPPPSSAKTGSSDG